MDCTKARPKRPTGTPLYDVETVRQAAAPIPVDRLPLTARHLADLRSSGILDETIRRYGIYSSSDPVEIGRILGWDAPAAALGDCLIFPFLDPATGQPNGFARIKPDKPRKNAGKYEQPRKTGLRAFLTHGAIEATTRTGELFPPLVLITEGEKKAIASDQAGVPAIGLTGVFAWTLKRSDKSAERELIPDLNAIDWMGRPVVICFDIDEVRKPQVNLARAELARVLTDRGAHVVFLELPIVRDANGCVIKMGIDDFIVRCGDGGEGFRQLVARAIAPGAKPVPLDEYRAGLVETRIQSIDNPGVYLDMSPMGAGKNYADIPALKIVNRSLTVLQTHRACNEVECTYSQHGIDAAAYPELSAKTCGNFDAAEQALKWGLSPSSAICPDCHLRETCGYQTAIEYAEHAGHRIITHHRATHTLRTDSAGCHYVTIHEDAAGLLRPTAEVASGLDAVAAVAHMAEDRVWDREDQTVRHYLVRMQDAAHAMADHLRGAEQTARIEIPDPAGSPPQVDILLYRAAVRAKVDPDADAMRVCRAIADGSLHELTVRVDRVTGRGGRAEVRRAIVAVWQTRLPRHAAVWVSDATADAEEFEALAGVPIVAQTTPKTIARLHEVLHVPADVTMGTSATTAAKILRGALARYPAAHRVGVIGHREHVSAIAGGPRTPSILDPATRSRIAVVEHFRGGQARGSNTWTDTCDLLIVLGTPRVRQAVIRTRLIAAGKIEVAAREPRWVRDAWSGVDPSGRRHTVRSLAYDDHDWHSAHRAVVAAELLQAVGRGRGICEHGIPVVVVSTEELGYPLAGWELHPISDAMVEVLAAIRELSPESPIGNGCHGEGRIMATKRLNIVKEMVAIAPSVRENAIPTSAIASVTGKTRTAIRNTLSTLESAGLVSRVGRRGGWYLTPAGLSLVTPASERAVTTPHPHDVTGGGGGAGS